MQIDRFGKTYRVHKCRMCGQVFLSAQWAVSAREAAKLADILEPMIPPTNGSSSGAETTMSDSPSSSEPRAS
jgi:NMD protein affecting ribosome stability and mRNA decay